MVGEPYEVHIKYRAKQVAIWYNVLKVFIKRWFLLLYFILIRSLTHQESNLLLLVASVITSKESPKYALEKTSFQHLLVEQSKILMFMFMPRRVWLTLIHITTL